MAPLRILVVEDSAPTRGQLSNALRSSREFELVAAVSQAREAVDAAARLKPDLVSLDLFIPGGSAAAIVRSIIAVCPVPIVLLSSASRDCDEAFGALAAGAVDFIAKPDFSRANEVGGLLAHFLRLRHLKPRPPALLAPLAIPMAPQARGVVAIGSSTGGPIVLQEILSRLSPQLPAPVVVAQHMAEGFEAAFVRWLAERSAVPVVLANPSGPLISRQVILAPSGFDLVIDSPRQYSLVRGPARGFHPSCDVLFETAANAFGGNVIAVVLSGIGDDGTAGARVVVARGGLVFAQDEESCISFGMPGSVQKEMLTSVTGSPSQLAYAIVGRVSRWRMG